MILKTYIKKQVKDLNVYSLDGSYEHKEESIESEENKIQIHKATHKDVYTYSICSGIEISEDLDNSIKSKIKSLFSPLKIKPEITSEKSETKTTKIYTITISI